MHMSVFPWGHFSSSQGQAVPGDLWVLLPRLKALPILGGFWCPGGGERALPSHFPWQQRGQHACPL
jgi:hypothetical protein